MEQRDFLRKKLMKKTREQINEKFAGKEIHIIKAVNLLTDLDSINNLMRENLNEWQIRAPNGEALEAFGELEKNTLNVEAEKTKLNEFVQKEMKTEFPNFSEVATPIIGAKLLSEAGSKKRLCFMPASTIQVLGAEKALFAHLRKNAKSPKHGHLFNHPLLQNMPRYKRGKAARIIAGKLAIALKQDYFGGEDTSKETKKLLEEKITELLNEPETEEQKQKEMEYEQINLERRREAFNKDSKKKDFAQEHRTFTPEERKAFFEKNNTGKPWTKKSGNYAPTEGSLSQKRKFTAINGELTSSYDNTANEEYSQNRTFDYPRERPFAPRREFGPRRSFGDRDRSNSSFRGGRRSFGPRRDFGSRPRREYSSGSERSFTQGSNYGPRNEERDSYNSERSSQRREEGQFHSDFKPRENFRGKEERHSRPSGHRGFGPNKFGNKSKPSFAKRTPRTAKRY
jgi:hypothetical protein